MAERAPDLILCDGGGQEGTGAESKSSTAHLDQVCCTSPARLVAVGTAKEKTTGQEEAKRGSGGALRRWVRRSGVFFNILSEVPLSIERWELGVMQLHTQRGPPFASVQSLRVVPPATSSVPDRTAAGRPGRGEEPCRAGKRTLLGDLPQLGHRSGARAKLWCLEGTCKQWSANHLASESLAWFLEC